MYSIDVLFNIITAFNTKKKRKKEKKKFLPDTFHYEFLMLDKTLFLELSLMNFLLLIGLQNEEKRSADLAPLNLFDLMVLSFLKVQNEKNFTYS